MQRPHPPGPQGDATDGSASAPDRQDGRAGPVTNPPQDSFALWALGAAVVAVILSLMLIDLLLIRRF
jgi:hypothetical protein